MGVRGELSERFKELVLKTSDGETHREFESHTLRQKIRPPNRWSYFWLVGDSNHSMQLSGGQLPATARRSGSAIFATGENANESPLSVPPERWSSFLAVGDSNRSMQLSKISKRLFSLRLESILNLLT